MQVQYTPHTEEIAPRNGVVILTGYGLRVAVERAHLIVTDGVGRERRQGKFSRATRDLRRLVVLGHTGTINFDALRWLADRGTAFVQIDEDGRVIAATGPAGLDDARLRRAQALATTNGVGLAIARDLLHDKLRGQASVLARFPGASDAVATVEADFDALNAAATVEVLRFTEAQAAAAYWSAWSTVVVPFARKDLARVPAHWHTFGTRSSPLTTSPRKAANPANALLNYLYAILEAEARIAALAVGLDPGMGVLHADLKARDSLACDLMEPVRPKVDALVLDLLSTHTFGARDFFETRQGVCRLMPPLTHRLAEMAPTLAKWIAPVVEGVARALFQPERRIAVLDRTLPTHLTQANRSAGRDVVRRKLKRSGEAAASLPLACLECGTILDHSERRYCDACLPQRREEAVAVFGTAGPAALAALREEGRDPAHGGEAGRKRGRRNAEHVRAIAAWEREPDQRLPGVDFTRDILPTLQGIPLSEMMNATGLSLRYCSVIRRGLKAPHPRHWPLLARLAGQGRDEPGFKNDPATPCAGSVSGRSIREPLQADVAC